MFNAKTKWKMPGAKELITLKWIQDWTFSYTRQKILPWFPLAVEHQAKLGCTAYLLGTEPRKSEFQIPDASIMPSLPCSARESRVQSDFSSLDWWILSRQ